MTQQASKRPSSSTLYYLRRQKNRKFNFDKFMFGNIYRKLRKWENSYILHHNPLEGNYHLDCCDCQRESERRGVGRDGGGL